MVTPFYLHEWTIDSRTPIDACLPHGPHTNISGFKHGSRDQERGSQHSESLQDAADLCRILYRGLGLRIKFQTLRTSKQDHIKQRRPFLTFPQPMDLQVGSLVVSVTPCCCLPVPWWFCLFEAWDSSIFCPCFGEVVRTFARKINCLAHLTNPNHLSNNFHIFSHQYMYVYIYIMYIYIMYIYISFE